MGSSGRNCAILDLLLYHHIRHLHGRFSDKFSSQIIFQIFQGKCKLICTMGPACWDPPMLIKLIETWQSLQPWCRAENAVPNAVLCGPPCCPSAVSRIRAWISPAWTSRTEIMRWGFPLYCLTKKKVITFGPKSCEPHSYKTETERVLWRGDIKKCPTVASSLTSETLVDFRATGELWRTSERLLLYLKCCVGKRQRTVWQCDFQMLKENSKRVGESAKTTFIIISVHMHVRCAHMRHILPKACKQRPDKPVAILLDTKVLPGKRFAKREADGSSFSTVFILYLVVT